MRRNNFFIVHNSECPSLVKALSVDFDESLRFKSVCFLQLENKQGMLQGMTKIYIWRAMATANISTKS